MKTTQALDIHTVWNNVLEEIKKQMSSNSFSTWMSGVYPLKVEGGGKTFVLGVPNELTRGWIQKNHEYTIISELMKISPNLKRLKLTISRNPTRKTQPRKALIPQTKTLPLDLNRFNKETNLNPDFVFDTFIVADYNRMANSAAEAVIQRPGLVYNPFYVYGPTGVGKTHLLQAIGNKVKANNQSMRVCYVTAESFIEEYVNAIKRNSIEEFRNSYSSYKLFIMDDIQFLNKGNAATIELFHLFNTLTNKNAQIILSSDQAPGDIARIEDRIRTRLSSGIVIDIQEPSVGDMRIICVEKAKAMNINLTDDAIEYIINNVNPNIRNINGALQTIHLHISDKPLKVVDFADVKNFIKNHVKVKANISVSHAIKVVCDYYNVKPDALRGKTRRREVVHARQVLMFLMRESMDHSYTFIGKEFGNRDHTTVIHSYEKVNTALQTNQVLQKEVDQLKRNLGL